MDSKDCEQCDTICLIDSQTIVYLCNESPSKVLNLVERLEYELFGRSRTYAESDMILRSVCKDEKMMRSLINEMHGCSRPAEYMNLALMLMSTGVTHDCTKWFEDLARLVALCYQNVDVGSQRVLKVKIYQNLFLRTVDDRMVQLRNCLAFAYILRELLKFDPDVTNVSTAIAYLYRAQKSREELLCHVADQIEEVLKSDVKVQIKIVSRL